MRNANEKNKPCTAAFRHSLAMLLAVSLCCTAAIAVADGTATITITSADGVETTQGEVQSTSGSTSEAASSLDIFADEEESTEEVADASDEEDSVRQAPAVSDGQARQALIDGILALAQQKFDEAGGRAQRAQYSGDIYVCKNFTVYLFRENRDSFRMAEYPDVELVIPDNQKKDDCKPYVYGVEWKDVPAEEGNPFYAAATFRYDESLSKQENIENARSFLKQVQRGDYFQMAAKYYYGTGAHSMIFTADYDEATDSVHWTDSNMKGEKRGGDRYGYVQYDAVKEIDWFVDAFCRKSYGATLYRLRDDIVYAQ